MLARLVVALALRGYSLYDYDPAAYGVNDSILV